MKTLALVLALALLGGCAYFTSPNAQYSYQRTGDDCTLTVDSGRVFAAGVDVKLTDCDVAVTAGKVEQPAPRNDLKDVIELWKLFGSVPPPRDAPK